MYANGLSDYGCSELQTCRTNVFCLSKILLLGLSPGSFFVSWQMPILRKLVCPCSIVSISHPAHLFNICLVCHMPVLLKCVNLCYDISQLHALQVKKTLQLFPSWLTLQLSKKQDCLLYFALRYDASDNKPVHQSAC